MKQVTKLDRDPSSGTALQEISFWLNLERALHRIQEKRESLEVSLTLDILKHGKRFHATVSFDTDTGVNAFILSVSYSVYTHVLHSILYCSICMRTLLHTCEPHTHTQNPLNMEVTHECGDE